MELLKNWKLCGKIHTSELFPTKWSGLIFVAYMAFFVNQGLLVTASQQADSGYHYNTIAAVLATEVVKLIISILLFTKDHKVVQLISETKTHIKVMYHYFVPAFLYCLYNNLAFVNLSVFDPTSYYLLLQFRVVVTGVLFQMLFKKQLSTKQWLSLVLLTAGCIIKQLPFSSSSPTTDPPVQQVTDPDVVITSMDKHMTSVFSWNMLLILIQIVCSCLAGVYNELLLKSTDSEACNIYIQNTFMYVDSIVCNVALLGWQGQLSVVWDTTQLDHLLDFKVILVILNNAAIGIVTSFFLRSLNSILKTFASALELIFTALLTWLFFSIPIHLNTFFAIFVVSIAVIMYSQNPVINVRIPKETTFKEVSSV
ncbi:UDP-galactose transporter senju [Homalodisca vitripennis]|uniref:CMP-sialic acid transporter n=1 Tax=Homalodisca liturata TaxID=320908 RepID=A0A1B6JG04_9HEMI|nr:UDP-galactose transporter senju [Homalodisca vitripennis]XP_046664382.1 UDP-galactose transporter senju [Homalodisca vitripennis]XP_046664383.1 UDP-galactose transporter senju [Homalodisca vitripennis]